MDQNREKPDDSQIWEFILYTDSNAMLAKETETRLREICNRYLPNRYNLKVINVFENIDKVPPDILAVPLVPLVSPDPERRVIGNLVDRKRTITGLGLDEADFI